MKISNHQKLHSPSFNAINLNKQEYRLVNDMLVQYSHSNIKNKNQIFEKLVLLFNKKIEEEVKSITGTIYSFEDCLQEYYLIFIEGINAALSSDNPIEFLLNKLNTVKVKKELISNRYNKSTISLSTTIANTNRLTLEDTVTESQLPVYASVNKSEQKKSKKKLKLLTEQIQLTKEDKNVLDAFLNNMNFSQIAKKIGVSLTTVNKHISKIILCVQLKNQTIPIDIENKLKELKRIFPTFSQNELENILLKIPNTSLNNIAIFEKRLKELTEEFKTDLKGLKKIILSNPNILLLNPETVFANIKAAEALLQIPHEEYIKLCLSCANYFYQKPETLYNNIVQVSKLLNISEIEVKQILKKQPKIIYSKPETLFKTTQNNAKVLGLSLDDYIDICKKRPQLLVQKTDKLSSNIKKISLLLDIPESIAIKIAIKTPNIFTQKPETIYQNIEKLGQLLKIDKKILMKSVIKSNPQVIVQNPETIYDNVEKSAQLLNISKEEFINISLKFTQLFYQKPKTLLQKLQTTAKELRISEREYLSLVKNQPTLLAKKPETLLKKKLINEYFSLIRKTKNTKIVISSSKDEEIYGRILKYLMNVQGSNIKVNSKFKENIIKYLQVNPNVIYKISIPEHKECNNLIEFSKNLSNEALGHNVFEFNIIPKEQYLIENI